MSDSRTEFTENCCVICCKSFRDDGSEPSVTMGEKGLATLAHFSRLSGNKELDEYLSGQPSVVNVHASCRRIYTSKRRHCDSTGGNSAASGNTDGEVKKLRSKSDTFKWGTDCFFCCQPAL
jgi:hypothetical protein